MAVVPFLEVGGASDIFLWFSLEDFGVVNYVLLDAMSVEGALILPTLLTVASFRCCLPAASVQDFLVVGLEGRLDVFGTSVRNLD